MTDLSERWQESSDGDFFAGLPGHPMMWILILSELAVFGALFVLFSVSRLLHPEMYAAGQAQLDVFLGGVNAVVLVTSGWLAALAVAARAAEERGRARLLLAGAIAFGCVFVVIKIVEYTAKVRAGIAFGECDGFFTLYYLMTGFHLLHVVLGSVILGVIVWLDTLDNYKTGTAFWHVIDLCWIVMYPLLYLVR